MAKKKKTQLKPVARGFATTSVPKKVAPVVESEVVSDVGISAEENSQVQDVHSSPIQINEFNLDMVEEQSLQNLVDKFQDKVEKETVRILKAINMDRRYSKSLPRLELDSDLNNHIINLVLELKSEGIDGKHLLQESEDKAIIRLGITYNVLRRLGFEEGRADECIRSINGVELDEAYEWLYLNCTEEELEEKRPTAIEENEPKTLRTPYGSQSTPRTLSQFLIPDSPSESSFLDAHAPVFVPAGSPFPLQSRSDSPVSEQASTKFPLASSNRRSSPLESGGESSNEDDLTLEYVRIKMKLAGLSSHGQSQDPSDLRRLRERLETIKKNYFFDEKEAEAHFHNESTKADLRAIQSRLRGRAVASPARPNTLERHSPDTVASSAPLDSVITTDISDCETETLTGGLFDEIPPDQTSKQGSTVRIRNMALPKHWSGRTPKDLLSETVAKVDRYAAINYQIISGPSRAKRAAVSIRWKGQKTGEWLMNDDACHDNVQAEQYIATIALHSLTFPSTDGFATGSPSLSGSQTSFRLLPAVFRDLWEELEMTRKVTNDAFNRKVWAKLRTIIEPKLDVNDVRVNGKGPKPVLDTELPTLRSSVQNYKLYSEQLIDEFKARQASKGYQDMLVQRNNLPIANYRQAIISSLEKSDVLVLSGETGCGKSTQVPTFILEDQLSQGKPCKIFCTEPRRISAISLAQRVSRELGDPPSAMGTLSSLVGYSIRLESNTSRNTRLTFVTNGIALRMLESGTGQRGQGTAFDEITHIIIDEVHERTIESDFLLIVLKSLLQQRSDLKVILMSATVDAEKLSNFFGGCPMLYVPGRTFPVDVRYLEDAVEFTGWAISENSLYAKRVHDKFHRTKNRTDWSEETTTGVDAENDTIQENVKLEKRYSEGTAATINLLDERVIPYDLIIRLLEKISFEDAAYAPYSAAVLIFMPGLGEIRRMNDILAEHPVFGTRNDFRIYPLHSTISSENQGAVFDIPPPGVKKIVIATNIAETGITIPDITCVIDSGKHREMRFDEKRQISRLVETFIAKSNAAQRRGRAGRVQQGLCFHLFTKIRHDTQIADHPLPEMMRLSLSDLALRIKIMKVKLGSSIEDVLSRALDPPASINVQRAISALVEVKALTASEDITPMGQLLSQLPTDVHLGKFLLIATLFRCLDPALTIAAALNSKSPFVSPFGLEDEADRAKNSFSVENSDFLTIHNAFASWRRASANPSFVRKFCRLNYLSHQNLQQIEELRQQFLGYLIDSSFIQVDKLLILELRQARYSRNRTSFVTIPAELDQNSANPLLLNAALVAGLYPKILTIDPINNQMRTISNNQQVSFHPSSVNFGKKPSDFGVSHLSYFTLMHSKKLYAWETSLVDDMAVLLLCGESDFKLISNSVSIDRKIRFHVSPKTSIALKFLRSQLNTLLAYQFRSKILTESQLLWNEVAMVVLGRTKLEELNH